MKFKCVHVNINITDVEKSVEFYKKALNLDVYKTKKSDDGSFILTYLKNDESDFLIELTWLKDHPQSYDLGENENHICFEVDDFEKAHQLHKDMDCICFENTAMGLYFINDPDDYWLEIVPAK